MPESGYDRSGPASRAVAITPDDSTDLANRARGIYVGVSGDVSVILAEDTIAVVFVGLAAGVIHPIAAVRIRATGTTATSIVALR